MSPRPIPLADPGVGREEDPIGSVGWAQRVRLRLQGIVNDVDSKPDALRRYVGLVQKHRAWTLMNKPDGSSFATWEEFCEFRQPWGLGKQWSELKPFVEAVEGKKAVQLATVAPAKSPPGKAVEVNPHEEGNLRNGHATTERLRAIAERAPEPVRDLYRQDLIGVKEAAALGPKNPKPEDAARVTAIAIEAKSIVESEKPKTDREKRAVQRKVNGVVRERLGREPDPVRIAASAISKVPHSRFAELIDTLHPETGKALLVCLQHYFGEPL